MSTDDIRALLAAAEALTEAVRAYETDTSRAQMIVVGRAQDAYAALATPIVVAALARRVLALEEMLQRCAAEHPEDMCRKMLNLLSEAPDAHS